MINEKSWIGKSITNSKSWIAWAPKLGKKWMRRNSKRIGDKANQFDKGKFWVMWSKKKMTLKKREMG